MKTVAVVDLFAGPGGLSEGFATWKGAGLEFDIRLSVEKDPVACRTLRLRKFFRRYEDPDIRASYYAYLKVEAAKQEDFAERHSKRWLEATKGVVELTLGSAELDQRRLELQIGSAIRSADSWILVGGPPCQAYSLVGRSRMRGEDPERFMRDHRHTLYREYLRIIAQFSPPMFVMENVKGLLSSRLGDSTAFEQIEADLCDPQGAMGQTSGTRYELVPVVQYGAPGLLDTQRRPTDYVVRSELHGVPQARHRVILVGIRKDLAARTTLKPLGLVPAPVTVGSVIEDLPALRSRLSGEADTFEEWTNVVQRAARVCAKQGMTSPQLDQWVKQASREADPGFGRRYTPWRRKPKALAEWFHDPQLGGVINHQARGHIREDLARYMFVATFAQSRGRSPKLHEFPKALLPEHKNVIGHKNQEIPFSDRFRAQRREAPSTTVTSHISKDGHYFIHPDPRQCRALSVREAARLQTFPDNYFFEGNRTQQYHQVGNAVPPYLAYQIAGSVAEALIQSGEVPGAASKRAGQ